MYLLHTHVRTHTCTLTHTHICGTQTGFSFVSPKRVNLTEDITVAGKTIPKGCNVNIPMFSTFRSNVNFPPPEGTEGTEGTEDASGQPVGPETFCPARFLGDLPNATRCKRNLTAFGASKVSLSVGRSVSHAALCSLVP